MNFPYSMQESSNGPLCEFRWQFKTFTRPFAKVTEQIISLYVIAVSSVSQDFGVHNTCTKRSSPGKTITIRRVGFKSFR